MKNKLLVGLIAGATVSGAVMIPVISSNSNHKKIINKTLLVTSSNSNNNINNEGTKTNEAVVVKGNSAMNLYALSNGTGIVSKLSTGEMLTVLGRPQGKYCKVWVQETEDMGYINIANMKSIFNGTDATFKPLSGSGQVINVSTRLSLRTGPSINNNIIWYLTNGEQFNILGKQGQWYKIDVNGQIGFVYGEYVSPNISSNIGSINDQSSTTINNTVKNTSLGSNVKNVIVKTKRLDVSQKSSSEIKDNPQNNRSSKSQNTGHIDHRNKVDNKKSSNSNKIKENGKIEIIKPNSNSMFGLSTVIVKNGTGKAISKSQLVSVMKYWILNGQYNCDEVCCADGTMWDPQWFKTVSDSELINAFIDANGKNALSKNITANELLKAAESLSAIVYKGKEPFSLEQAKQHIKEMLAQSYPNETITKIVPVQGGYYVYTTPYNKENKWPFWVVNAYTGYAQS